MKTKLIGKGAFSKAYLLESGRVLLKSCCPIKECMSLGWFPNSPLFPAVERVDYEVYEMDFYPRVSSLKSALDPDQWEIYRKLKSLMDSRDFNVKPCDFSNYWRSRFESELEGDLSEAMVDAMNACDNYGSEICFEISPRNVAAKDGKLILIDVFFSHEKLLQVKKSPVNFH